MQTSIDNLLRRGLRYLILRGYGWKRRKRHVRISYRNEWRDPATGHWHAEKTALRLLKGSILAEYGGPNRDGSNFSSYF